MDPFWKEVLVVLGIIINAYVVLRLHYVASNVQKIETATNSMKDALVEATRAGAQASGEIKGRQDAKDEAGLVLHPSGGPKEEISIEDVDAIKLKK